MPKVIEVLVSPKGDVQVQTKGYAGGECFQASKFLEHALGVTAADHKTAEYFQAVAAEQHVHQ